MRIILYIITFLSVNHQINSMMVEINYGLLDDCKKGNLEGVKYWLETRKEKINFTDYENKTPLIYAVIYEHESVVDYLLKRGANVHINIDNKKDVKTAFHYAVEKGNLQIMDLLAPHINLDKEDNSAGGFIYRLSALRAIDAFRYETNRKGEKIDRIAVINRLITLGIALTKTYPFQGHFLCELIITNSKDNPGLLELVQLCLDKGVSVETFRYFNDGPTPLMVASSRWDNKKMVKLLLNNNANVHAKDSCGETPIFYANCPKTIKLLIQHGANLADKNKKQETVLHSRLKRVLPKKSFLVTLLENPHNRVDINAQDEDGNTALHCMAIHQERFPELIPLLLFYGADPTIKNNNGQTPAHCALNKFNLSHYEEYKNIYNLLRTDLTVHPITWTDVTSGELIHGNTREFEKNHLMYYIKQRLPITKRLSNREHGIQKMPTRLYIHD